MQEVENQKRARQIEIPSGLVEHVREWLGEDGITFFRRVKLHKGRVNCVLTTNEHVALRKGVEPTSVEKHRLRLPHPIHFREGMAVRNAMRKSPTTEGWTDHDFDSTWSTVVERAIGECPTCWGDPFLQPCGTCGAGVKE